jgi:hypothetical protein
MEQGFAIPYVNTVEPSPVGWSIWKMTDLDWSILRGLPGRAATRQYFVEDIEDGRRLMAECTPTLD